ncbi:chorismate synthase [Bacillus sp. SL00103]
MKAFQRDFYIEQDDINYELARRQKRSRPRQKNADRKDQAKVLSGVRHGKTLGSPIAICR